MMNWAKDLKEGDEVRVYGIECVGHDGITVTVRLGNSGLYLPCVHGEHILDGQLDEDGFYIGVVKL